MLLNRFMKFYTFDCQFTVPVLYQHISKNIFTFDQYVSLAAKQENRNKNAAYSCSHSRANQTVSHACNYSSDNATRSRNQSVNQPVSQPCNCYYNAKLVISRRGVVDQISQSNSSRISKPTVRINYR